MAGFKSNRMLLVILLTNAVAVSCAIPRAQAEETTQFGFTPAQYNGDERFTRLSCVRRPCRGGWGWVFNAYVCYCVYRPDLYSRGMR